MARQTAQRVNDEPEEPADDVPEPTIRDAILSARDEVIDRQASEREPPAEGAEPASGPLRDDSGRFTRRSQEPGDGMGQQPAGGSAGEPAAGGATQQPAQSPAAPAPAAGSAGAPAAATTGADLAPQAWSAATKAIWSQLPPAARTEINRREADFHRAITAQDEQRTLGKTIHEITQQNLDVVNRTGQAPVKLYSDFLNIIKVLSSPDPGPKTALLRDVALRNGLDLRALVGLPAAPRPGPGAQPQPGQQPQQQQQPQPQVVIPPEIASMANEWNQFKAQQQREAQERTQAEETQTLADIMAFRAKPEARFFDQVKDHMIQILQVGAVATLEEAYEQACWTRPDIRDVLIKEQSAQRTQAEQRRQQTANARAKGGSVRGGAGGTAPAGAPQDRTLRQELEANFAAASARV
jgi:hypothetical protein